MDHLVNPGHRKLSREHQGAKDAVMNQEAKALTPYHCVQEHVLICGRLFATPWMIAHWAPLSGQDYWSVLLFPSPGDLPDPGIEPTSSVLQTDSSPAELLG